MAIKELNDDFNVDRILSAHEYYDEESGEKMENDIREKIFPFIKKWATKLSGELIKSIQYLWDAMTDPQVPWKAKSLAITALAYLISPIDAIPDFLPFGLADDAAVITAAIALIATILIKHGINIKSNGEDEILHAVGDEDIFI